ncbi:TetR/AcrR family transcriptional regulator [Mycobacterium malmoense]|uniref:TetR/AcrR family transcriptional regulator n=1 Tax=Mycobacterium malmoense TaxID=1780 RepID=UPI0009F38E56|nr:TetR/AcrR family transcriptional regulator [Mycobacterium malmoense]
MYSLDRTSVIVWRKRQLAKLWPVGKPGSEAADWLAPVPRPDSRWRVRSTERATEDVRKRAHARSDRFLLIALELLSEGGAENLSVRKVVERSGMSLRSFYQSFSGTDDLFLAIYEEATLGGLERQLAAVAAAGTDPLDRLRAFMQAEWLASDPAPPLLQRALVSFHQRLSETRPAELSALLEPQHRALTELLAACRGAGMRGPALDDSTIASILLHTTMEMLQARVLGFCVGENVDFDQLWKFLATAFTRRGR